MRGAGGAPSAEAPAPRVVVTAALEALLHSGHPGAREARTIPEVVLFTATPPVAVEVEAVEPPGLDPGVDGEVSEVPETVGGILQLEAAPAAHRGRTPEEPLESGTFEAAPAMVPPLRTTWRTPLRPMGT